MNIAGYLVLGAVSIPALLSTSVHFSRFLPREVLLAALTYLSADDLDALELVSKSFAYTVSSNVHQLPGRSLQLDYCTNRQTDHQELAVKQEPSINRSEDEDLPLITVDLDANPERLEPIFHDPKLAWLTEFRVIAHILPRDVFILRLLLVPLTLPPLPYAGVGKFHDLDGPLLQLLVEGGFHCAPGDY